MCSMRLNFFMCKVEEMLPHESLGCMDSMSHQVILGLLMTASGSPVTLELLSFLYLAEKLC